MAAATTVATTAVTADRTVRHSRPSPVARVACMPDGATTIRRPAQDRIPAEADRHHDPGSPSPTVASRRRGARGPVLAGDREAFRALVDREGPAVVRACHRILGDLHEAEDAAQEAFVTAFRSLAGWRGDGPFGAWLTRIAVRIALRRAQRRRAVTWIEPGDPTVGAVTNLAGGAGSRGDDAPRGARRRVRAAVAKLDEPYRETVALRFFGELWLAEIAAETGRPLGTVKTHLHRGLLRLRTSQGRPDDRLREAGIAGGRRGDGPRAGRARVEDAASCRPRRVHRPGDGGGRR